MSIVIEHSQQMNAMNNAGLVKFPRYPEKFLQLLLAQMIQHPRVHEIRGEALGVLRQAEIGQPLGAHPSVAQLYDAGISYQRRMSVLLNCQSQFLPVQLMGYTKTRLQLGVAQLQQNLSKKLFYRKIK